MHFFLGIEAIKPKPDMVLLNQAKYIRDHLQKAGIDSAKPMPSPLISSQKLSAIGSSTFHNPTLYRSVVGGLQYATITRPDIAFVVNKLSQFMHAPLDSHWKAVKRVLKYLAGTISHGLTFL